MNFDIFDRVTETTGRLCTSDTFYATIDDTAMQHAWEAVEKAAQSGDHEALAAAKRRLPVVTWQASFADHERKNEKALPSGLFMLDVDHIADMASFSDEIISPLLDDDNYWAKQIGIVAVHHTPSGNGMRFVAKCPVGMTTIESCQQWLAAQLGILTFDTACKDFARASYLVPLAQFLYIDKKGIWDDEPINILPNSLPLTPPEGGESGNTGYSGHPSLQGRDGERLSLQGGAGGRLFSDAQKSFRYRGHLISDIAAEWVKRHGEPQQGERHTYYYKLCNMFRYITDGDIGVLLAQLPDFGLGIAEREKEAEHACRRALGTRIPYTFYTFLVKEGFIEVEKEAEKEVVTIDLDTPEEKMVVPPLPPVFREFCAVCPPDFVYPAIVALLPVLGTLTTRLRAHYLDGRVHTTSFISVIFAPQSAGKSFARDIVRILTADLRRHDEISVMKEKQYKAELRLKKNSDQLPEDPHAPYRMVQAVISVPRLLQRQEDAGGLHQLSFVEEIDTLTKSNAGGSYAQKSDLYRQAFDNVEYGQDYLSVDTFTGSVNLYYNILMLGTPKQLFRFFNDAENGLVTRCCFAELMNQEFAPIPVFKPITEKQMEVITKAMNKFEAMTYRRRNAQSEEYMVQPEVNIDAKMQPIREALMDWLEQTRMKALEANDISLDTFRRRAAVKAFRLGMICVALYEKASLHKAMPKICRFVTWFATQDARQSTLTFGRMLQDTAAATPQKSAAEQPLIESLPETFTAGELIATMAKKHHTSSPKIVVSRWKKAGYIKINDDGTFTKTRRS